jgi:hypothetical protein
MLWPGTFVFRVLFGRRTRDKIALLDILDINFLLRRFQPPKATVCSSGEDREDKKRQADAEEKLHEHMRVYRRRDVSAVRHAGVWVSGEFFWERQFRTVCSLPRRFRGISESEMIGGYGLLEWGDQLHNIEREQRLLLVSQRVVSEDDVLCLEQCMACVGCDAAAVYLPCGMVRRRVEC